MIRIEQCDPVLSDVIREEALYLFEHEIFRFEESAICESGRDAGNVGRYYTLRHEAAPGDLRSWLGLLAPRVPDRTLSQACINVYFNSGFVPDVIKGLSAMAVVALQSHPKQGVAWYRNGVLNFFSDNLGMSAIFDDPGVVLVVPPVVAPRLSITYIYS